MIDDSMVEAEAEAKKMVKESQVVLDLARRLFNAGVEGDKVSARRLAKDMIDWYNVSAEYVEESDLSNLFDLAKQGKFRAWSCPTCGDRVYEGRPDNWDDFQGVSQVDYTSYPPHGRKTVDQCDHCRMTMVPLPRGYAENRRG